MTTLFLIMALISASVTAVLVQPLRHSRLLAALTLAAPLGALAVYLLLGRPDL